MEISILADVAAYQLAVEPRFNEPLNNEALGIMNDIPLPSNSKISGKETRNKKNLVIAILPVLWPFVISRFHSLN